MAGRWHVTGHGHDAGGVTDGKIDAVVERTHSWGILLRVERSPDKGVRLKPERGLHFPDTELQSRR